MPIHYRSSAAFGQKNAPFSIKLIVFTTLILSLLSALLAPFNAPYYLALSLEGLKQGFVWQLITSAFLLPSYSVSFSFLLRLAFNLYLIWTLGSSIIERMSSKHFLWLFFLNALFSSGIALILMAFGNSQYLFSSNSMNVFACLTAYLMLNKDSKLILFFTIEIKAKWLISGLLALILFSSLSHGDIINFSAYLFAALFTYFYALMLWHTHSPFIFLQSMEKEIIYFLKHRKKKSPYYYAKTKIFDFKTKKPLLDDEEFIDAMLAKISQEGKDSLTRREKKRLKKITKRKNKSH